MSFNEALSEVWANVSQPFWQFQSRFGAIIIKNTKRHDIKFILLFIRINLIFFSKNKNPIEIIKYIAAYLDIKPKPKKIPNKTKFINLGESLITKTIINDKDQKRINKISVDNKKEDKDTAGARKKDIAVTTAISLLP